MCDKSNASKYNQQYLVSIKKYTKSLKKHKLGICVKYWNWLS